MPAADALAYPRKGQHKRRKQIKKSYVPPVRIAPGAPRGQRTEDNSQSQTANAEANRQNETEASEKGGNVRDKTSIPANSIQDKIKHPYHLQGVLKPLQAISI